MNDVRYNHFSALLFLVSMNEPMHEHACSSLISCRLLFDESIPVWLPRKLSKIECYSLNLPVQFDLISIII